MGLGKLAKSQQRCQVLILKTGCGGNGCEKVRFCGGATDVAEQIERYGVDGAIVRGDGMAA